MFKKAAQLGIIAIISIFCIFFFVQGCVVEYVSEPLPPQGATSNKLMVIIHGLGASSDDWPLALENAIDARLSAGVRANWDIVRYGWEEYAVNAFAAANAGPELGNQVGTMLSAQDYDYDQIHFVAHCVGSLVAHAAATTYAENAAQPAAIHMTYLDPALLKATPFGSGADFAEDYFNSDDPMPKTGIAVADSHNFDITQYMLRDVGTAEGHIWPINYYILTVEDDRIPYGFQLSPMINTTPVDFNQYPAGATTTLFDELPIETVTLSSGSIDLPLRYTEATVITAFELATFDGDRTTIGFGAYQYRASTIGPYTEAGIVIPVVKIGDPLPANFMLEVVKPPLDRIMGFYVLHIPADSEMAEIAGKEIWGFTKIFTSIDFYQEDNNIDVTVYDPAHPGDPNTAILNFAGTVSPGFLPIPMASSLTMSVLNGDPIRTINHLITGSGNLYFTHDILLTVGGSTHPMADNLRDLGVDLTQPTMVEISFDYQSLLYNSSPM